MKIRDGKGQWRAGAVGETIPKAETVEPAEKIPGKGAAARSGSLTRRYPGKGRGSALGELDAWEPFCYVSAW